MAFATSPQPVIIVGGPIKYYTSYESTGLYVEKVFSNLCHSITIQNTHVSDPIQLSFDGATLHGDLSGGESITIHVGNATGVYLKSTGGLAVIRVWGW